MSRLFRPSSKAEDEFPWYVRLGFGMLAIVCLFPSVEIASGLAVQRDIGGAMLLSMFVLFVVSGVLFSLPVRLRMKSQNFVFAMTLVLDIAINIAVVLK